mmetsp:Transcript_29892/g.95300  ORF Transcript_29892/g.95300 Transcript_29892/m.95300 type:complete len:226 (-) Transcript_29892:7-684(-)
MVGLGPGQDDPDATAQGQGGARQHSAPDGLTQAERREHKDHQDVPAIEASEEALVCQPVTSPAHRLANQPDEEAQLPTPLQPIALDSGIVCAARAQNVVGCPSRAVAEAWILLGLAAGVGLLLQHEPHHSEGGPDQGRQGPQPPEVVADVRGMRCRQGDIDRRAARCQHGVGDASGGPTERERDNDAEPVVQGVRWRQWPHCPVRGLPRRDATARGIARPLSLAA